MNPLHSRLVALMIAFVMMSCGGDDRKRGEALTVTVLYPTTDERGLGPEYDSTAQFLMFLPLVTRNAQGQLEGRLAKSWEPAPDYQTWTIHLREDVLWHDGTPVTAHDIEFTTRLLSRPDVGYIAPGEVSISLLDDYTFTYTSSTATPLSDYRTYYPKHLLENLDPTRTYEWDFWTQPIGNGPYRYVRHLPETMMELEVNPEFVIGTPQVQHVILKFGPSSLAELLSGNVDVLADVNPMQLLKLRKDPRFRRFDMRTPAVTTLYWNHRNELFKDAKVRRALTLAINRRELLDVLNLSPDLPLFDVIFAQRHWNSLPDALSHDPELAGRLLEEVGWRDEDGGGIRRREGVHFQFDLLVTAEEEREAVYIQNQLREIGVQMDITRRSEWVHVFQQIREGEFEAAISRFLMELPSTMGQRRFFGEGNYIGYQNERVFELLEMATATQNPRTLDTIYLELMKIFQADLPAVFLHPVTSTHIVRRHLAGLSSPYRADPVWYMEHIWLQDPVLR